MSSEADTQALQQQLDADPQYQALKAKFQATKAPLDWLALLNYANRPGGPLDQSNFTNTGKDSGSYNQTIDGNGNVVQQETNAFQNSPGYWGLISAGVLGGAGAAGAFSGAGSGAEAAGAAGAGTGGAEAGAAEAGTGLVAGATPEETAAALGGTGGAASGAGGATGGLLSHLGTASVASTGISAAANLIGAYMQASATKDAAAMQQVDFKAALDYAKQVDLYNTTTGANRYAAQQAQTAPYRASGIAANAQMDKLLGLPAPPPVSAVGTNPPPTYNPALPPGLPTPTGPGSFGPTPGAPTSPNYYGQAANPPPTSQPGTGPAPQAMVTLRAPDGSTKAVPQSDVAHYVSLGAVQV